MNGQLSTTVGSLGDNIGPLTLRVGLPRCLLVSMCVGIVYTAIQFGGPSTRECQYGQCFDSLARVFGRTTIFVLNLTTSLVDDDLLSVAYDPNWFEGLFCRVARSVVLFDCI